MFQVCNAPKRQAREYINSGGILVVMCVYLIASQMQTASIEWLLGRYTNVGGD